MKAATRTTGALPTPRRAWESTVTGPVVVGVDGSQAGYRAFEWAARHALLLGTDLQVYCSSSDADHVDLPIDDTVQRVLRRLPMLTAHFRQSDDDPVLTLTSASADAALLVLGGHGRTHSLLGLGTLVLPVVSRAPCDVAVVRGRPEGIRGEHGWITAAVGGQHDRLVLTKAVSLSRTRVARLRVLHLRASPLSGVRPVEDVVLHEVRAFLRRVAPDLTADFVADDHHPHEAFAGFPSDVLVLGRGRHNVGLTTRTALHHASCPVLVVTGR